MGPLEDGGSTALYWACYQAEQRTVGMLLDAGADANAVNNAGNQPLHAACSCGHAGVVRLLLEAGAQVQQGASEVGEDEPLFVAAAKGHTETVQLLLSAGACVHIFDDKDASLLHAPCRWAWVFWSTVNMSCIYPRQ